MPYDVHEYDEREGLSYRWIYDGLTYPTGYSRCNSDGLIQREYYNEQGRLVQKKDWGATEYDLGLNGLYREIYRNGERVRTEKWKDHKVVEEWEKPRTMWEKLTGQ